MNKIEQIKDKLKVYQQTPEYKEKLQFDLTFQGDSEPAGIYMYNDDLFIITRDELDLPINRFTEEIINKIYKQVVNNTWSQ